QSTSRRPARVFSQKIGCGDGTRSFAGRGAKEVAGDAYVGPNCVVINLVAAIGAEIFFLHTKRVGSHRLRCASPLGQRKIVTCVLGVT
ncbi:MAG: hypothetical protein P8M25_17290, partial [Paracoccaceae bacterium]|nr:hypothetical protein [Paracoccaceae bacterium]